MIDDKRILAIIPARGGSKAIVNKNIVETAGFPLIYWSIKAARDSYYIDSLVCSTDDDKIASVAKNYGCPVPYQRNAALSDDFATSIDVVLDVIAHTPGYDYVLLLQPTSPLRTTEDIDSAIETSFQCMAPSCVSLSPVKHNPAWMYRIDNHRLTTVLPDKKVTRRQDLPEFHQPNGAIYFASIPWLIKNKAFVTEETVPYVMPSSRAIDIDEWDDHLLAQHKLSA